MWKFRYASIFCPRFYRCFSESVCDCCGYGFQRGQACSFYCLIDAKLEQFARCGEGGINDWICERVYRELMYVFCFSASLLSFSSHVVTFLVLLSSIYKSLSLACEWHPSVLLFHL